MKGKHRAVRANKTVTIFQLFTGKGGVGTTARHQTTTLDSLLQQPGETKTALFHVLLWLERTADVQKPTQTVKIRPVLPGELDAEQREPRTDWKKKGILIPAGAWTSITTVFSIAIGPILAISPLFPFPQSEPHSTISRNEPWLFYLKPNHLCLRC